RVAASHRAHVDVVNRAVAGGRIQSSSMCRRGTRPLPGQRVPAMATAPRPVVAPRAWGFRPPGPPDEWRRGAACAGRGVDDGQGGDLATLDGPCRGATRRPAPTWE